MAARVICASLLLWGALAADTAVQPADPSPGPAEELPLTVVSTIPPTLLQPDGDGPIDLQVGSRMVRRPVQVVYSRAVVPLGSDAANPPAAQTPFTVIGSGAAAGTFRWLNSYVASFAPADDREDAEWGTDITLDFAWNADLQTFDGVPLSGAAALSVRRRRTCRFRIQALAWQSLHCLAPTCSRSRRAGAATF